MLTSASCIKVQEEGLIHGLQNTQEKKVAVELEIDCNFPVLTFNAKQMELNVRFNGHARENVLV